MFTSQFMPKAAGTAANFKALRSVRWLQTWTPHATSHRETAVAMAIRLRPSLVGADPDRGASVAPREARAQWPLRSWE